MKLLGWMHRKLMQNSTEPIKNTTIGKASPRFAMQTCFDEKDYYAEPTKALSQSYIQHQKSSNKSLSNENTMFHDEEPFDFLAIGTFGLELLNRGDPPTPTLPTPFEESTNQITENDLQLINYELEKFIEAEEKEILNDTSGRSSYVSITTLVNKPSEGADSEEQKCLVDCPLQNYLLATSIELAETDKEVKKEKVSLGELFERNNVVCNDTVMKCEELEQKRRKKSVGQFMKKVGKKIHLSSSSLKKDGGTTPSLITKKLAKALKMFHKKVHPEKTSENQSTEMPNAKKKYGSNEMPNAKKKYGSNEYCYQIIRANESNKLSSEGICEGPSTGSGHWIKTDSDYLVLEL